MELRVIAERMRATSEYLRGAAWIGMGISFLRAISMGKYLWKAKNKRKMRFGKKSKKVEKLLYTLVLAGGCGAFFTGDPIYGAEISEPLRIEWVESPHLEREGVWYYNQEFGIRLLEEKNEEEQEEKEEVSSEELSNIEIQIRQKNTGGEWEEIEEEQFSEKGIMILQEEERCWEIRFSKPIQCQVIGRWEEENADSDFSVWQEVALDQNAPVILETEVLHENTGEQAVPEKGTFFSRDRLKARLVSQDETGIEKILCEGVDSTSGEMIFQQKMEGEGWILLPQDFCGRLIWKIEDYSGNELVWEQPEIFCIESLQIHREHSGLCMEITEETSEGALLKMGVWDHWSGIRKIWLKKDGRVFWEEWLDQKNDRIYTWENFVEVTVTDEKDITVTLVFEDRAGYQNECSVTVEGKEIPQEEPEEDKTEGEEPVPEKEPETEQEEPPIPWKDDRQEPKIMISGVEEGKSYSGQVSFLATIQDAWLDWEKSEGILYGERQGAIPLEKTKEGQFFWKTEEKDNRDDVYRLLIQAWDRNGNVAKAEVNFLINQRGSVFRIEQGEKKENLSETFELLVTEENRSEVTHRTVMCIWEGRPKVLQETVDYTMDVKQDSGKWIYQYRFLPQLFQKEGRYTIHLVTADRAGNRRSNLHFYDEQKQYRKLPIEFCISSKKEQEGAEQMKNSLLYFRQKKATEKENIVESSKKEESFSQNKETDKMVLRETTEKEKRGESVKGGAEKEREKIFLGRGESGGLGEIRQIGKWILLCGAVVLHRMKRRIFR